MNLHRRQLTKEQKKEIAANLREQGWTQERIGKALGVTQQTISNWIPLQKFVNQNSDNSPSPTQNLEAIIAPLKAASLPQISAKAQAPTMRRKASWNLRR